MVKRLVGVAPVLLLSIALVVSAVIGLNSSRGPSLIFPVPVNAASLGVARAHLGDRWSIGMESTICLDKPGTVEITGVTPVRPHGLRVIGFAVRPNQSWKPTQGVAGAFLGEVRAPLQHLGFTSRTVDVACEHNTPKGYELAVRLLKTTPALLSPRGGSSHTVRPHESGRSRSPSDSSCAQPTPLMPGDATARACESIRACVSNGTLIGMSEQGQRHGSAFWMPRHRSRWMSAERHLFVRSG